MITTDNSLTLQTIVKHVQPVPLGTEVDDLDFPFDLEKFCVEMDAMLVPASGSELDRLLVINYHRGELDTLRRVLDYTKSTSSNLFSLRSDVRLRAEKIEKYLEARAKEGDTPPTQLEIIPGESEESKSVEPSIILTRKRFAEAIDEASVNTDEGNYGDFLRNLEAALFGDEK